VKSRVLTAIGLIPFVLGAFFCANPWPIAVLAVLSFVVSSAEFASLLKRRGVRWGLWFAFDCFPIALIWLAMPLWCLVQLHAMGPKGHLWELANPILLAVVPLWGGDTAAIFAGRAFGKHPLAPKISPNKTVEGGIANLAACAAVAVPLGLWMGYPWWICLVCGLSAGIFGQAGDLFESFVKRRVDAKDSGTLLPGHGGLLDRIDSVLFTAPVVYGILLFAKPG